MCIGSEIPCNSAVASCNWILPDGVGGANPIQVPATSMSICAGPARPTPGVPTPNALPTFKSRESSASPFRADAVMPGINCGAGGRRRSCTQRQRKRLLRPDGVRERHDRSERSVRLERLALPRCGSGWEHKPHFSHLQVLLQHGGMERKLVAASAPFPHRCPAAWQLTHGEDGLHIAGCGEIGVGGPSWHGGRGPPSVRRESARPICPNRKPLRPALRVAADPEHSSADRRFALHVAQGIIGRGVGSGAVHPQAQALRRERYRNGESRPPVRRG